ncbi:hypothetical protein FBQ79_06675 [Anaerolineae bacterium AMX1]|nr:hypothetical protein [Anaerolineae bacterium AMX1]
MKPLTFTLLILSLLLAGCSSAMSGALTPENLTPDTETPDTATRLDPADWKNWPVVPRISARALEIYRNGLALGNDPHAFSKIGDCQSVPASFLGIYDTDRYRFAPEYQILQRLVQPRGRIGARRI